jgi:hypothetical protein
MLKQIRQEMFYAYTTPHQSVSIIEAFAPLFWKPAWEHAPVLLWGAILTPAAYPIS